MVEQNGKFVWFELMTTDPQAAEAFYSAVAGWKFESAQFSDRPYRVFSVDDVPVGGIVPFCAASPTLGVRPGWLGYIAVGDVDQFAFRLEEAGGRILRPAEEIPEVGRVAVVSDPDGAAFVLFAPCDGPVGPQPKLNSPGRICWCELQAGDPTGAFSFYSDLFGWTKTEAHDLGAIGMYQTFAIRGVQSGAMMLKPPEIPAPVWIYYFFVDSIVTAVERVVAAGGTVCMGPHQVPGGSWIAYALDPQGVMFAFVALKN